MTAASTSAPDEPHRRFGRGMTGRPVFRGWLLVFFLFMSYGAITRAIAIVRRIAAMQSGQLAMDGANVAWLLFSIAMVCGVLYGLFLLVFGDRRTPNWWVVLLSVSVVVPLLTDAWVAAHAAALDNAPFTMELWAILRGGDVLRVAVPISWICAWMTSERVRRTFGTNAFPRERDERAAFSRITPRERS